MAYKPSPFLALLLISTILLATTWQVSGRHISPKNSNTRDKKEPQFFSSSDGSVYIPGIGRVGYPPFSGFTPQNPDTGGSGGIGSGSTGGVSVPNPGFGVPNPGFGVPNPGFGVPSPASGGGLPTPVHL
ncbi:putative cell wall protein [Cajanus cajan]|uniref:Cell wall protein n=1 Tax=Cajanus cajan TaxID=3821 RepID=A0A151SF48_CAJCA|nr:putative cell wall protein [Cajanus cajan]KYP53413.1 hypothetical protein KK1_024795 [Cajanus cajan]